MNLIVGMKSYDSFVQAECIYINDILVLDKNFFRLESVKTKLLTEENF